MVQIKELYPFVSVQLRLKILGSVICITTMKALFTNKESCWAEEQKMGMCFFDFWDNQEVVVHCWYLEFFRNVFPATKPSPVEWNFLHSSSSRWFTQDVLFGNIFFWVFLSLILWEFP